MIMRKIATLLLAMLLISCATPRTAELYVQRATLPADATAEQRVDIASRVVPSARQLAWQRMELTAFLHFGINTFTGNEWGDGTDSPALFNPTALDCEQWVRTLKGAGFKMVILTAKHHDGFCLWPTATTDYSVARSPWREGGGDIVAELRAACDKHNMRFGLYLSPWDRNAACYGDSPAYNKLFIAQLTELLTRYGRIDEVWFDGACAEGPNGKRQEYDWEAIMATIRRLQPDAVTAIMGSDVRWVGNEGGLGRSTEWSVTPLAPASYTERKGANEALGINDMSADLGSRDLVARATELYWYPSEVDVSIRPGWFYHAEQNDDVRTLGNLVDIYYRSVGRNSVLLLNIPPDRRGLIHETDAIRLAEFGDYLRRTFATNHIVGRNRPWCAAEGTSREYRVRKGSAINTLLLQEDITRGQRVESFTVEARINGSWQYLASGTTIGYKRLVRFSDCRPEGLRVTICSSRGEANIKAVGAYYGEHIADSQRRWHLNDLDTSTWRVVEGDSAAIDNDSSTAWRTEGLQPLIVDMGEMRAIAGLCYAPATDNMVGTIYEYRFYVSCDGESWTLCNTSGEFSNIMYNPIPYYVRFGRSYDARYFKLEPTREINGERATTIAEVGILLR